MSDTAATAATASAPPSDTAPAADTAAPAAAPSLAVGNLVTHTWTDDYDGERTRYGIVVDVLPADAENDAARVVVGWLEGPATMPADSLSGA